MTFIGFIAMLTMVCGLLNGIEALALKRMTMAHVCLWVLTLLWLLELAYRIGQRGA